ncbi:MAG TPA: multidrug ABC transporter ATP-binding protein [Chloroflexi bacterium]|nr:multidrug ABC transporter ATP-binding protein [Chloroflexota bacterium]
MSDSRLEARNLCKTFGQTRAVDRVSLSVRAGEAFGLVGPDGAGKTTTMRLLTAIMAPTSGDAWVSDLHTVHEAEALKERIGYMSQRFGLYPDLTVQENIDFYADIYSVPRRGREDKIDELLGFSNLTPFRQRQAGRLSGGMKQKLALACTLVHEPKVVMLDEPTTGVDPVSRRAFWDLIFELSSQGVTVFVTTHYMDEAEHCHTLGLLSYGQLIALGSPAELKANMRAGQMLELDVADALRASTVVTSLPAVHSAAPYGDKLHVLVWGDAGETIDPLSRTLAAAGLPPRRVEPVEFSLEDLFVTFIEMQQEAMRDA